MQQGNVISESSARLASANLLTHILSLQLSTGPSKPVALVGVSEDLPEATRIQVRNALIGISHELVEIPSKSPVVVNGESAYKDGQYWPIGTEIDVAWIQSSTSVGLGITAAIPAEFESYATVVVPRDDYERQNSDNTLVDILHDLSGDKMWWLGYLDTGTSDVIFHEAPRVELYAGWPYVLVLAGAQQTRKWRADTAWRGRLPDLIFPVDKTWLVSMLWDNDWRSIGGPAALTAALTMEPTLESFIVSSPKLDSTPPGHVAR